MASEMHEHPEVEGDGRSARKRRAILDAATEVFLKSGYLGTNMDEIAALSSVSKQTVYKHFSSKEALFIEIVGGSCATSASTKSGCLAARLSPICAPPRVPNT